MEDEEKLGIIFGVMLLDVYERSNYNPTSNFIGVLWWFL